MKFELNNLFKLFKNDKIVTTFLLKFWDLSGAKVWKSCRSRKSWKNEYLVAIVAVDTAENGPPKVWRNWIIYSGVSLRIIRACHFVQKRMRTAFSGSEEAAAWTRSAAERRAPRRPCAWPSRSDPYDPCHCYRGPPISARTFEGSFSAVWVPTIARVGAFFHIFRDLQDSHSFAPLHTQIFVNFSFLFLQIFSTKVHHFLRMLNQFHVFSSRFWWKFVGISRDWKMLHKISAKSQILTN